MDERQNVFLKVPQNFFPLPEFFQQSHGFFIRAYKKLRVQKCGFVAHNVIRRTSSFCQLKIYKYLFLSRPQHNGHTTIKNRKKLINKIIGWQ